MKTKRDIILQTGNWGKCNGIVFDRKGSRKELHILGTARYNLPPSLSKLLRRKLEKEGEYRTLYAFPLILSDVEKGRI